MSDRILEVYFQDLHAGRLEQKVSGALSFRYAETYITRENAVPVSVSLPLQSDPFTDDRVKAYFSGLLPDATVRERLANCLGLSEKNAFALLEAIGGECAGALSFRPPGEQPPANLPEKDDVLDAEKLAEILELIKRQPLLAGDEGYRLSLAGAQNKLAVGFRDDKITLVKNSGPTTHILKPLIDRVMDSAHNEFFCMRLAKAAGLDAPDCFLRINEDIPYYLVRRYDRRIGDKGKITRLHQEDFCQALSIPPEMKYEREGGPGVQQCRDLIAKYSANPASDLQKFSDLLLFNHLIGNSDAHGKNFSFLYKDKKPVLAPAYDLLSTAVYPDLSKKTAMKIGGKYDPELVFLRHWHKCAVADTDSARRAFDKRYKKLAATLLDRAAALKKSFRQEGLYSPIYEDIEAVIKKRSEIL